MDAACAVLLQTKVVADAAAAAKAAEADSNSSAWGAAELIAARRRAAVIALQHATSYHKHSWAQTGIELLVEHCWKNK